LFPDPKDPDYDFGQAPALYTTRVNGKPTQLVGAGQKSGQYGSLDSDTGAVAWVTQAGPGGTGGGLQWGSAVDGQRVYTANSNSNSASASRTTSCTRSSGPRRKSD
jgi:polyvinyl alcohol dehydrogenase (cytochrome)